MIKQCLLLFLITFAIGFIIGYPYVKFLTKRKYNQTILEYVEVHANKKDTPTMGGIIFIVSCIIACAIFIRENNFLLILSLLFLVGFGLIGFLDDFIKIKFKRNLGLRPYQKIIGQGGLSLILSLYVFFSSNQINTFLPFTTNIINFGFWIIPIVFLVTIATTNAVNLIDGLDGLATKVSMVYLLAFATLLFVFSDKLYYLGYSELNIMQMQNLAYGCVILSGALLAFLIFNCNKAKVFMGDVGSLALGGFISCIGILSGLWLYIPLLGVLYVLTALSVLMQVAYYKKTKKRIFLMAPLHHHFEKKGVNEQKIVTIYTIISIIVSLVCIYFSM